MSARARLQAIAAAPSFDPLGHRLIERLLDAGLDERAARRIDKLEDEIERARVDAAVAVRALEAAGGEIDEALTSALREGDLREARRLAIRAKRSLDTRKHGSIPRWARAIAGRAQASAARLPSALASRIATLDQLEPAPEEARALAFALSRALFDESVSATRATVALARASDNVPEVAGPYNTHALAAHTLRVLASISPEYVASYVAMLDDLASLEHLDASTPPQRKKPRTVRSTSTGSNK